MKKLYFLMALLALTKTASAQYQITHWTVDAGGGQSAGGGYTLKGSVGQAAAGTAKSGTFQLVAGFYGVVAVTPQEGGPRLRIATTAREVIVAWPSTARGYQLQEAADLTKPAWTDVRQAAQLVGSEDQVRLPWQVGNRYFRLHQP
jgi:hypothetical protein